MRFKKLSVIMALAIIASFFVFSANAKAASEVSGRMYFQAGMDLDDKQEATNDTAYSYQIKRVYLTYKNKLNDVWSVMVRTDVKAQDFGGKDRYSLFIKNAYFQGKWAFGAAKITLQGGMFGTPNTGFMYSMSDYRWVDDTYLDQSKVVLPNGNYGETSADMGFKVKIDISMLSITIANVNGEGFGDVEDAANSGKAWYGNVTVNPIENLYIAGIGRYERELIDNDNVPTVETNVYYYGAGIAWKTDMLKIGAIYTMGEKETDGTTVNEMALMDAYLNMNLESVIGMPVLVMANYAFGEDDKFDDSKVQVLAAGVGYKFNKNIRCLLYYQQLMYDTSGVDDDQALYLKTEAKF